MAALQAADITEILNITQKQLGRAKITDNMSDYQDTIALKRILKKKKMTFDSGPSVQFTVVTDTNGSARGVGLAYQAIVDMTESTVRGEMPWRHMHWNYAVERRLIAMNRAPSKIFDYVKLERLKGLGDFIKYCERRLWRFAASTNTVDFQGLPYWIVKSSTAITTNEGFNGTVQSGYTTVAGLSPTTYDRWRNFAGPYTAITKDDFITKMREMLYRTDFKPLVDGTPTYNTGDDMGLYTNYTVMATLERLLEDQNESLGTDLASMDGKVTVRRTPVTCVKELDSDTTNPVYSINWGEIGAMGLETEWMNETAFEKLPNQPTVSATFVDSTMNTLCRNRRRQGVLSNGTTELA